MAACECLKEIPLLETVLAAWPFPGEITQVERYGQGHISDTFCVVCHGPAGRARFVLQGLSQAAFPWPEKLMDNFVGITSYLRRAVREQGGDPSRETLSLVKTRQGKDYFTDDQGRVWRLTPFIEDTQCFQTATPQLFEEAARAFGNFQYMLRDYPAGTLHETIQNFHNTEARLAQFLEALAQDPLGRAKDVQEEVQFVLDRRETCSVLMDALRAGKLPLRVTHNDTKLNNVLFDRATGRGICIVDLDTTMPGLAVTDFGDAVRDGANNACEDEQDLTKVNFDLELFEYYTRGFLQGCRGSLTESELEYLPWGARIIALELGMRFLTDHLLGDGYFHITRPGQNLDRCRTQFKLARDMEAQFAQMQAVVAKYAHGA